MAKCCCCATSPACRTQITSADLAELLYVQGLDVNLCTKFAAIADLFQFRDCLGNVIEVNSQIVTCAEFASRLCTVLGTLASGGSVELGVTEVVGADCTVYTIPETVITVVDSSSIDLTASGTFSHTLTAVVRISADAGNILVLHADGLYVPVATPTTVAVADTATIDMTIAGAPGSQIISAVAIVSPDIGNDLVALPNGLFVDVCDALAAAPSAGSITPDVTELIGADCQTYTVPAAAAQTPITPVDTNCINLSVSGVNNHTLQADVIISPAVGNAVTCTVQGLFVAIAGVTIQGSDTGCIDMSVVEGPAGTFTVLANPIISATLGNQLVCTGGGLYVPDPITTFDCGQIASLFVDNTPARPPAGTPFMGGNCQIYVLPNVVALDTTCINTTVTNVAGDWVVSSAIILDPDPCNELVCAAPGLMVREGPRQFSAALTIPAIIPVPVPLLEGATFTVAEQCLDLENLSECSVGLMFLNLIMPGYIYQPTSIPARVRTSFSFTLTVPGGPPPTSDTFTQTTEGTVIGGEIAVMQTSYNIISQIDPAPAAGELCISLEIEVLEGDITIQAGVMGADYGILTGLS